MFTIKHQVTLSAPGIEAGLANIGEILMTVKEDLQAAIAQDKADADRVIAALTAFTAKVADLIKKLDDATAGEVISADEVRGIITDLNAEHAALDATLAANPADTGGAPSA